MREIVFDTETTGLDSAGADRLVEIGCVELLNGIATGATFHAYVNPERPMDPGAQAVHGLGDEFLADKPRFREVVDELLAFLGEEAKLVAHNASFDVGFMDAELRRAGRPPLDRTRVVDTLLLARRRHPGQSNSLDALCARYGIDRSERKLHGALLDARLLAEVYLELCGGRQAGLSLAHGTGAAARAAAGAVKPRAEPLPPRLTDEERAAHEAFVGRFVAGPGKPAVWGDYGLGK